ncbi:MAG TPA: ParB N-terminal domain-containing protein, partial [Candidatus Acidoferrales bacterium]|nr:ParB N-terminal domain-containing protein [Candidatus Acidoferrales bacterium]
SVRFRRLRLTVGQPRAAVLLSFRAALRAGRVPDSGAASIETYGVLAQRLVREVHDREEVIAGERRLRAAPSSSCNDRSTPKRSNSG